MGSQLLDARIGAARGIATAVHFLVVLKKLK